MLNHKCSLVFAVYLTAGTLMLGCGKAEYERLIQQRTADLRSGRADIARWKPFQSERFHFTCQLPATPVLTENDKDGIESEKVEASVGATAYQILFLKGDPQPIAQATNRVRQQYQGAGYKIDSESEIDLGGVDAVRLLFSNPESGTVAQVQVVVMDGSRSCAMSVVGDKLNEDEAVRFFDSFAGN